MHQKGTQTKPVYVDYEHLEWIWDTYFSRNSVSLSWVWPLTRNFEPVVLFLMWDYDIVLPLSNKQWVMIS